jgi:DNA repair protein RadC
MLELGATATPVRRQTQPDGTVHLREADDSALLADLLGRTAFGVVEDIPAATLLDATARELTAWGLPSVARRRLLVAAELARRFQPVAVPPDSYERPQDFLPHLQTIRTAPVETLAVLTLDTRMALLGGISTVASGGVMHIAVAAREVFAPAIERRAVAIVLAHNHPSGDPEPSQDDRAFTRMMTRAGAVLGIQVLDHVIVTRRAWFSFKQARYL